MWQDAEDRSLINGSLQDLDGRSKSEVATELLRIAKERDKRFEDGAIVAEREGDTEATWLCMACRRENQRFIDKLEKEIASMRSGGNSSPIHRI